MRALHMILMAAIFCCGLHVAEPVQAHGEAAHHGFHQSDHDHDDDTSGKAAADADHAIHHHCPVAPAPGYRAETEAQRMDTLLFARPCARLSSLLQAPPVEPPAS